MSVEMIKEYLDSISDTITSIKVKASYLHDVEVNQMYDDKPYSYHICGVADIAFEYLADVVEIKDHILPIIFGAYFHDSIEDARLTYNDVLKIAREFMEGEQALMATEIVYALTNEKGRNRQERANDKYYQGIQETPYAPFVKACDRLFNMRYSRETGSSMCDKYKQEYNHFIKSICDSDKSGNKFNIPNSMKQEMLEM